MVLKVHNTINKRWLLLQILGLILVQKEQEMIIHDEPRKQTHLDFTNKW